MIVTLDWDNISRKEAYKRIKKILNNGLFTSIDLYRSPSKKGYHVYLYLDLTKIIRAVELGIRKQLKDDPKRLQMDIDFDRNSVLFDTKIINGIKHKSKFIRTWTKK